MISNEEDWQEADIPQLAVKALTEAHRRAIEAGHPLVLVKQGCLVRQGASGITVLKQLPARNRVAARTKLARS